VNRVALVTGAAGGIGRAIAARAASAGDHVHCTDVETEALNVLVHELTAAGASASAERVDQSRPEDVEALFVGLSRRYGRLDACYANAGIGRFGPFLDLPLRAWQRHIDVNLTGTFLVVQAAALLMADSSRGGAIVVTSSSGAFSPPDLFSAYCVSKAALNMLVRSTAAELGPHGIRINAVMPGVVDGGMADGLLTGTARASIEAVTPLGRTAQPDDVAAVATFLAGPEARYVTGTSLLVDGGQTIHAAPQWVTADARAGSAAAWVPHGDCAHPA
jgi:NAD(P)-dependent dehydrogenase (short-subunit alcohol dehydrogenase family)